jgi:gliding motility-associated-like protein
MEGRKTTLFSLEYRRRGQRIFSGSTQCLYRIFLVIVMSIALSLFSVHTVSAQLILTPTSNPAQLVQTIVGAGYAVSNVKVNCPSGAIGLFTSSGSNIGVGKGILLTTGQINIANGPNNNQGAGVNNGAAGDFDLSNLAGAATYDGCALEFDIIPACDTLKINYVFGSEEYPEYVNKQFNDVFAFFISGPGFTGLQNIALVPGTALPVSINNVNAGKNSQYYIDNTGGATIQYDGFTTPLTALAKVTPCSQYHLKLVIADVLDGIFDSGVFIQGNTIECSPITYNDVASNSDAIKSCSDGSFSFCRTGDTTKPYTVSYTVGGTAIPGTDYVALSGTATIPANQKCFTTNVVTLANSGRTGTKTVKIIYQYGSCPKSDTITLHITDPPPLNAGPDLSFCSGDTVQMGLAPMPNTSYTWQPATGLSNAAISNPKISLVNNTNADQVVKYILTATNQTMGACVLKDSILVTVHALPHADFSGQTNYCIGSSASFTDNSTAPPGTPIISWYWNFGNSLFDNVKNPSIKYTTPGTYTVVLRVKDTLGCKDDTSLVVHVWPSPVASFGVTSACQGDSVHFSNSSSVSGGGTILQSIWNFGDSSPLVSTKAPVHKYPVTGTTYTVQLIVTSDKNCLGTATEVVNINPRPKADFTTSPANVCLHDQIKYANLSNGDNNQWNFGDGITSTLRNPFHTYATAGIHTIQLVSTTNFGCSDTISKTVTINALPVFNFTAQDTAGCPYFCTQYTGFPLSGTDSIKSWTWIFDPGDSQSGKSVNFCYRKQGKYSPELIATSVKGCVDTIRKAFFIDVYPKPLASFAVSPGLISIFQPSVQVLNTCSPDVTNWWWNFGDTKTDSGSSPAAHKYTITSDQYVISLRVQNSYGCVDTVSVVIGVQAESAVYIANAFTPNGDGINDHFRPYYTGVYELANAEMLIYDRWGQVILKTTDLNYGWDGYCKGELCQQDVYVYEVYFTDKTDGSQIKKLRGIVSLVR